MMALSSSDATTATDGNRYGTGDLAIEVSGVSKNYKIYDDPIAGPLKERLFPWRAHKYYKLFSAVKDVSFSVRRGQIVGILGPNGSGKTTLLKCIAGLLPIDQGNIAVRGQVRTLLVTGVGVHPEFSGRENIFFSGLTLGMRREEIEEKLESIIEFAELGDYIEQPLRTYSAGMRARLLFSISMSVDPDILIVDEALSAGDAYFIRKCDRRFRDICASGATVLFVSHSTTQIEELCSHSIFMLDGKIAAQGKPVEISRLYYQWVFEKEKKAAQRLHEKESLDMNKPQGTGEVVIDRITLHDPSGEATTAFYAAEPMTIKLQFRCPAGPIPRVRIFCGVIVRPVGTYVCEMDTSYYVDPITGAEKETLLDLDGAGTIELHLEPLLLINNDYSLWIKFYVNDEGQYRVLCDYRNVAPFFASRRAWTINRGPVLWQPFRVSLSASQPQVACLDPIADENVAAGE